MDKAVIASLWLGLSPPYQATIVLCLLFLVLKPVWLNVLPNSMSLLFRIVHKLLEFMFRVLLSVLGFFFKTNFGFLNGIEKMMRFIVIGINWLSVFFQMPATRREKLKKQYYTIAAALIAMTGMLLYVYPANQVSAALLRWEDNVIRERLHIAPMPTKEAIEQLDKWLSGSGVQDQPVHQNSSVPPSKPVKLKLRPEFDGGFIRKEPKIMEDPTSVVTVIGKDEFVLYLGEKKTIDSITWYKVQTDSGASGWISGNIITTN